MVIKNAMDKDRIRIEKLQMGKGYFLSCPKIMLDKCPVTIHYETIVPGCSIGKHYHSEETEYYYMLSGQGTYCDNGNEAVLKAGDVAICGGGEYHFIENNGDVPIVFMGIISAH
jgi:mannose-6-phosphate isomerase-like protein (cupin superfamily)